MIYETETEVKNQMPDKVIVVTSCASCPFHSSTPHHQLEEGGEETGDYFIADQHLCGACLPEGQSPSWWTDKYTPEGPAIRSWCPLEDRAS